MPSFFSNMIGVFVFYYFHTRIKLSNCSNGKECFRSRLATISSKSLVPNIWRCPSSSVCFDGNSSRLINYIKAPHTFYGLLRVGDASQHSQIRDAYTLASIGYLNSTPTLIIHIFFFFSANFSR